MQSDAKLSLEGFYDVHGSNGPAAAANAFQSVANDFRQERLEDGAGLLVDWTADALDTTTASETADSPLGSG